MAKYLIRFMIEVSYHIMNIMYQHAEFCSIAVVVVNINMLEILCRIIMLNHIRLPCTLVQCHVSFIYYVISLKGGEGLFK